MLAYILRVACQEPGPGVDLATAGNKSVGDETGIKLANSEVEGRSLHQLLQTWGQKPCSTGEKDYLRLGNKTAFGCRLRV